MTERKKERKKEKVTEKKKERKSDRKKERKKERKKVQNAKFKKFISSLLFGIQIFIDLYSIYRYMYICNTCATAKSQTNSFLLRKERKRKNI